MEPCGGAPALGLTTLFNLPCKSGHPDKCQLHARNGVRGEYTPGRGGGPMLPLSPSPVHLQHSFHRVTDKRLSGVTSIVCIAANV